ncbi:type VII secretion protein EccB [Spirillospora sp. NPDC048911]|uniref:type VII secretion protein EccB n=1 Tax=Spirillospora sp. NPDC048911 TaxID=3364527 RepID=UPI00371F9660
MQTKRDLLQAHQLMTQRASQALILGEPDNPEQPLKRLNIGTFSGIMAAVLVAAGFGVAGLLMGGGGKGLDDPQMLLIEKQTGTRYVWCTPQGQAEKVLCPVANYASAKLAVGGQGKQKSVSSKSLSKFARGPVIGIAGAPDSIPDRKRLVGGPWSVCVRTVTGKSGQPRPAVSLVGGKNVGGRALDASAAVVVSSAGTDWLVYNNQRLKVSEGGRTVLGNTQPVPVSPVFVNAMPEGPAFGPPDQVRNGFGRQVNAQGGATGKQGQVFHDQSNDRYYVLMPDGYASITKIQASLIQSMPEYANMPPLSPVQPAQVTANPSRQVLSSRGLPDKQLQPVRYDQKEALCVVYKNLGDGMTAPQLTVGGGTDLPVPTTQGSGGVDNVVLPPGSAVLAGALVTNEQAISSYYFISDNGWKYAVKNADAAKALGYTISADSSSDVEPVPAALLQLLKEGPALALLDPNNPPQLNTQGNVGQ